MKQSNPIENLTESELRDLIETLEEDLKNMQSPDYFDWDGARGFYEATLEKAKARLGVLTSGKKSL